jgi:gliding motility-associated-like protein
MVTANAGDDKPLCNDMPFTLADATATNFSSISWTHNGQGSLSDTSVLNPIYTPSAGETGAIGFNLTVYGTSGCSNNVMHYQVTLTIYQAITVYAGPDQIIDSGATTSLHGNVSGGSGVFSYNWEPEAFLIDNTGLNPNTLPLDAEKVFTFLAFDAISGCSQSDQVTIGVDGIIRPIANDDYDTTGLNTSTIINVLENDIDVIGSGLDVSIIRNPANGIATLADDGFITYAPLLNFTGNDTLIYKICDRGIPSKCDSALVIITIFPIRDELDIFNLVTPDGDGKNDYWHIGGIENYPDNEVLIFNRWGTKVKEYVGYNNANKRWDGTNDKNEYLPDGVYYYILKIKDLKTYTGWIYIRGSRHN